jgi:hypothetical protein
MPKPSPVNAAEELLALHLAELGLRFERQYEYVAGRRFRADFAVWAGAVCARPLLVEVVGGVYQRRAHGSVTGVLRDIDRLNAATMKDLPMLRFTPQMVESGQAKEMIAEFFGLTGDG